MEKQKKSDKAIVKNVSLLETLAIKYNLSPEKFLETIKATVMKPGKDGRIASNEEIMAFLIVANKYNLNPFTNEIYAFPSKKGGIVPVVGIDGFVSIMNRNYDYDGMDEPKFSDDIVTPEGGKPCPDWCEIKIYRKDKSYPTIMKEHLDEVYVPASAKGGYPGPWQTHTKRMLRHKAIIQCARLAFGISGIYDPDEAERIIEAEAIEAKQIGGKPEVESPVEKEQKVEEPTLTPYGDMLLSMAKAKAIIGHAKYYEFLKPYKHANEIKTVEEGKKILDKMSAWIDSQEEAK